MTDTIIMYIAAAFIALLVIISLGIKIEKITKIMVWNFMIWFMCCVIVIALNMYITTLWSDTWLYKFLSDARYIIAYLLYIWGLLFIYYKFTIKAKISSDPILEKSSYLIFVPLNSIGLFIMPIMIYVLPYLCNWANIQDIAVWFTNNLYLQKIIIYLPYIFILYTIFSILSFCEFKWDGWAS